MPEPLQRRRKQPLTRELTMTTTPPTQTALRAKYRLLKSAGKLHDTINEALRKRDRRSANQPPRPPAPGRFLARQIEINARNNALTIVPLGDLGRIGSVRAQDRRKVWTAEEAGSLNSSYTTGSNSDWSKRSTFRRYLVTQSVVVILRGEAIYTYNGKTYLVPAPRGYRWKKDANGLCLTGAAGDYHPTGSELAFATLDRCKRLVEKLKANAALRKQEAKKAKQRQAMVKRAERDGAMICLRDSLRAGNCLAGSTNWAQRHGLNPAQHYRPSEVLALANGDASRVAIVAAAAIRRHVAEMERGYCELADHR